MKTSALLFAGLAAMSASLLPGTPLEAAPRTWVSSTGTGMTCSRAAPCADFPTAHAQTDPGGEINCVDSGNFSPIQLSISKSITIDCTGHTASLSSIGAGAAVIVGALNIVVVLRGLSIEAAGVGIDFLGGDSLAVENCRIADVHGNPSSPSGIWLHPSSGSSALSITDTIIENNGASSTGGGIVVAPTGSGSARVVIDRTRIMRNSLGIVVDGTSSSGRSVVTINDSVVAGSSLNGITVNQAGMVINRTSVEGNGGNGILAGPGALIHLGGSTVATNAAGGLAYNGGQILSYQDNKVMGNGVDNAPSGVLALK